MEAQQHKYINNQVTSHREKILEVYSNYYTNNPITDLKERGMKVLLKVAKRLDNGKT